MINSRKKLGTVSLANSRRSSIEDTNRSSLPRIQSNSRPSSRIRVENLEQKLKMIIKEENTKFSVLDKGCCEHDEAKTNDEFGNFKQLDTVILKNRMMTSVHFSSFSYRHVMMKIDPNFSFPALFRFSTDQPLVYYVAINRKPTSDDYDMKADTNEFLIQSIDDRPKKRIAILIYSTTSLLGQLGICFFKQAIPIKPLPICKPQQQEKLEFRPERDEAKAQRDERLVKGQVVHKKNMLIAGIFKDYSTERRVQTKLLTNRRLDTARETHALRLTQASEQKTMTIRYRQIKIKKESLVRDRVLKDLLDAVIVKEWLRIIMFVQLVPNLGIIIQTKHRERELLVARFSAKKKFYKKKRVVLNILLLMRNARLQSQNPINNIFLYVSIILAV